MKIKVNNCNLINEVNKIQIINLAQQQTKAFTYKFYQYSKQINNLSKCIDYINTNLQIPTCGTLDYFPIPLVNLEHSTNDRYFDIELDETIKIIECLVNGYIALNSCDIKFTHDIKIKNCKMPFEQTLLDQIMIGLISNIMYFIRDTKHTKHISLIIDHEVIMFINDGFALDQKMMIDYCQRIFYETGNPYIISFGQIFIVLNTIYNFKFEVYNVQGENIVKLHFKDVANNCSVNHDKVVPLINKLKLKDSK